MTLASGVTKRHRASDLATIREFAVAALSCGPNSTIQFLDSGGMRPTLSGRLALEIAWQPDREVRGSLYLVADRDTGGLVVSRLITVIGTRWVFGGDNDQSGLFDVDSTPDAGRQVVGLVVRAVERESDRCRYVDPAHARTSLPSIVNLLQADVALKRHEVGELVRSSPSLPVTRPRWSRAITLRARLALSRALHTLLVSISRRLENLA